jgi:hypothetical protein
LDFQFLTNKFGLTKELQDQSRKGVLLYLHVFLCGMSIWGPKSVKNTGRVKNIFFFKCLIWIPKIRNFTPISKMGQFTFVTSPYEKNYYQKHSL